jgi:hypothetical protein
VPGICTGQIRPYQNGRIWKHFGFVSEMTHSTFSAQINLISMKKNLLGATLTLISSFSSAQTSVQSTLQSFAGVEKNPVTDLKVPVSETTHSRDVLATHSIPITN